MIPSGNPGKFSTSVVSMSWPPGWSDVDDGSPSITSGARLARAVYTAAVSPAGPEPTMITSWTSAGWLMVRCLSVGLRTRLERPAEGGPVFQAGALRGGSSEAGRAQRRAAGDQQTIPAIVNTAPISTCAAQVCCSPTTASGR